MFRGVTKRCGVTKLWVVVMTLRPCLHAGDLHSYSLGLLSSILYTLNRQQILPENSKCSLLACSLLSCPVKLPTHPHLTTCHIAGGVLHT
jgi:hypothetical protein